MSTPYDYMAMCGWKDDPAAVEKMVSALPFRSFSEAAPDLKDTGKNVDVFFWEIEEAVLGHNLNDQHLAAQGIGDCVSWGLQQECQDAMLLDVYTGDLEEFAGQVATEPIYGGSRCQIGGWWNDYGDGSIGAYAVKWVTQFGVLLRQVYGSIDLTKYSAQRAKTYGAKGCPKELESIAKIHPITQATPIRSYEETRDAICNLKACGPASNVGFTMKRDVNGFCAVSGSWNHQMKYRGHCIVKGNKPAIVQANNWGDYLGSANNRVTLESGREITLPPGHFLITPEACTRQTRQGDSFALAGVTGWKRQKFSGVV